MTTATYSHVHSSLPSAVFKEEDAVLGVDDWMVYLDESLERWEVYVDGIGRRTFVSSSTWDNLDGAAENAFEKDFVHAYLDRKVREMRFINTDAGPYGVAARAYAAAQGTDTVRPKDRMVDLAERADSLVVQAASLNRKPTEVQLQTFAVRHARMVEEMAALEADLVRLRSKVDLAGLAVADAVSS